MSVNIGGGGGGGQRSNFYHFLLLSLLFIYFFIKENNLPFAFLFGYFPMCTYAFFQYKYFRLNTSINFVVPKRL